MIPDEEQLMAYADGELDPLSAKRVERAIAANPALAKTVEAHRNLRAQLGAAFAPVLDVPVPDHLTAMLESNVVAFTPHATPPRLWRWPMGMAVAASLVVGIALGTQWHRMTDPILTTGEGLIASADLARTLDTQLASASGDTHVLVSFRDKSNNYCRVFAAPSFDGIACKSELGWQLRQTDSAGAPPPGTYRQAGSDHAQLMAIAQDMMRGEPLDEGGEKRAQAAGWQ